METCPKYFVHVSGDLPPRAAPNIRKIVLDALDQIPKSSKPLEYDIDIQHDLLCNFWRGQDCDCSPDVSVTEVKR
jgi:hypothetical protein